MMPAIGLTDKGLQRDVNEDAFWILDPRKLDAAGIARWGALYLVADGMGGHQAGEVASSMAATLIPRAFYADRDPDRRAALIRAIQHANAEVWQRAQHERAHAKMGATLVAALVQGQQVTIAHAGDSRAYLWQKGRLRQLTEDHTWVNERYRQGILTAAEAAQHPLRHVVTRSLGEKPQLELSIETHTTQPGDLLLLCSDGLSGVVPEAQLAHLLGSLPPEEAASALVRAANAGGGPDNITVVIAPLGQAPAGVRSVAAPASAASPSTSKGHISLAAFLAGMLLLCLVGLLATRNVRQVAVGRLFPSATATATLLPPTPLATAKPFPTPAPRPAPVLLEPFPEKYYAASFNCNSHVLSEVELLHRFDLPLLKLVSWRLSQLWLPPFKTPAPAPRCLAPRSPYGIVLTGEISNENGIIPQRFDVGRAYSVTLAAPLPASDFEPHELRDVNIWEARIWGRLSSPRELQALQIELRKVQGQDWYSVYDHSLPHASQWFYVQQQVWKTLDLSPALVCADSQDWIIAYLRLNTGTAPEVLDAHCLKDVICTTD